MAKGSIVTDGVKALIASVYQQHPKWKAKTVRNEVSYLLTSNNPESPSGWPSLSTVQKVLADVRKKVKELPIHPEDKTWSLATLDEYPISPQALPVVIKVYTKVAPLRSIREAKWVARLSPILEEIKDLYFVATRYAAAERVYQSLNLTFNSVVLDMFLFTGGSSAITGLDSTVQMALATMPFSIDQDEGKQVIAKFIEQEQSKGGAK